MQSISVLLPTRARPAMLLRALNSLLEGQPRNVQVLVGIDDDDTALPDYRLLFEYSKQVDFYVAPRGNGVASVFNRLARAATGDLLWSFSDDYVVTQAPVGWATALREAAGKLEEGLGIFAPTDEREPGLFNMFGLTRATYEIAGSFMNELYPFWFPDREWDEIGQMADARQRANFSIITPDGHGGTAGMRDLAFWVKVFHDTRILRINQAQALLAHKLLARAKACEAKNAYLASPAFIAQWGSNSREPMGDQYDAMRARAEELLQNISKRAA